MEIIIPEKQRNAIHPVLVVKEAWVICWKNIGKLSVIYLIFNLPIVAIYLTPMANKLQNQKVTFSAFICIFLPVLILSIWGHIALLLGAKKAVDLEHYTLNQSIVQARHFFFKYLGTGLIATVFLMSLIILGVVSVAAVFLLLLKANKIMAISVCLVMATVIIGIFIYFMLRWSLATTVCVLEDMQPVAALKRGFSLVTEYVHPVVGAYCLFTLIYIACLLFVIIIGIFLGVGKDVNQANWVGTILSTFINIVLVPFWTIITVVLYKKLKEALEAHVYA